MKIKNNKNIGLLTTLFVVSVMTIILIILLIFQQKIMAVSEELASQNTLYEKYYVLIAEDSDDVLWESVYAGAVAAGAEADAYVEIIEDGDGIEYSVQEKMRIAIDSNVDGIILSSDGNEETTLLINEAVEKGIPVITVLNDDTQSMKQSYVGVNMYSLGEEYGRTIWGCLQEYLEEKEEEEVQEVYTVAVLMDASTEDTGQNTAFLGMKEFIENAIESDEFPYLVELESVAIDRSVSFEAEEKIAAMILANTVDIIVCLNADNTDAAYRTIVDYNEVGNVQILGYYETEDILEAISKEIIQATITVDGEEVGRQCIRALQEYEEMGYVSEYFPVTTYVLTTDNVDEYLEKYEEEGESENE